MTATQSLQMASGFATEIPEAELPRFGFALDAPVGAAESVAADVGVRVVVADPFPLMLRAITDLLLSANHLVVGSYTDGKAALEAIRRQRPQIAVLDLPLARLSGLDILRAIRAERLATEVVLLTAADAAEIQAAVDLGVAAVVPKRQPEAAVLDAIMAAGARRRPGAANGHDGVPERALDALNSRDRQLVGMVVRGFRNKQIAHSTAFSEASVKFRLYNIYRKLGVGSRVELINKVQRAAWA